MKKNSSETAAMNTNPFSRAVEGLRQLYKHNKVWAIILIILGVLGSYDQYWPQQDGQPFGSIEFSSSFFIIVGLGLLIGTLAGVYVNGVLAYVTWKTSRQENASLGEAITAVTERFWTILGVQVWSGLKVLGGLLLFIIPGVRAALRYQLVLLPVFDEDLKAKQAMERIKDLSQNHLIEIFGFTVAASIIPFVNLAMHTGGEAVLYNDLKRLDGFTGELPKVHWLNYVGFILVGLILGAMGLVRLAISAAN